MNDMSYDYTGDDWRERMFDQLGGRWASASGSATGEPGWCHCDKRCFVRLSTTSMLASDTTSGISLPSPVVDPTNPWRRRMPLRTGTEMHSQLLDLERLRKSQ